MKTKVNILSLLTIFLSSLVTAGPVEGLEQLSKGLIEVITILIRFVSDAILNINSFDELLFAKILLFTIIILVVYTVIKENTIFGGKKNKPIQWIISSAVSILAIRYLPDNFVQAILLQYGTFAIAITVFLPLMIYFFFIHQSNIGQFGRRAGWMLFAIIFFMMWSFRDDLGNANWIYWIGTLFIIMALLFDKSIHRYFGFSPIRKAETKAKLKIRVNAQRNLKELRENKGYMTDKEFNESKDHYEKIIKDNI